MDAETVNLRINKVIEIQYYFMLEVHFTTNSTIYIATHYSKKQTQNILTYHLLLHNTLKTPNNALGK